VVFKSGVPIVLSQRTGNDASPVAALYLNPYLEADALGELVDARVICLYDGDTAHVIDSGVTLFEWP
jgi:hypothetical protein